MCLFDYSVCVLFGVHCYYDGLCGVLLYVGSSMWIEMWVHTCVKKCGAMCP